MKGISQDLHFVGPEFDINAQERFINQKFDEMIIPNSMKKNITIPFQLNALP